METVATSIETATLSEKSTNTHEGTCNDSTQVPACPTDRTEAMNRIHALVWRDHGREPLHNHTLEQLITQFGIQSCWSQAWHLEARLYHAKKPVTNPAAYYVGSVRASYTVPKPLPEGYRVPVAPPLTSASSAIDDSESSSAWGYLLDESWKGVGVRGRRSVTELWALPIAHWGDIPDDRIAAIPPELLAEVQSHFPDFACTG